MARKIGAAIAAAAAAAAVAAGVAGAGAIGPGLNGRLVFQSTRDGNTDVYALNSDGSGLVRMTRDPAFDGLPSWSPSGGKLLFESTRNSSGGVVASRRPARQSATSG